MKRKTSLGPCPACGAEVSAKEGFYGCSRWREGCDFTLDTRALAHMGHPVLTPSQVRKILKGPTQLPFRTANGTERLYWVSLQPVEGRWRPRIDFEKGSEAESLGRCPLCGANVIESALGYGCERWDEGCEFTVFKNAVKRFGGKMLSKKMVRDLLRYGKVNVTVKGFDGSPRTVNLLLDDEYGCKIDFKGEAHG